MDKGEKFVFGIPLANTDLNVHIPPQASQGDAIKLEEKVFLISGSKKLEGFVVAKGAVLQLKNSNASNMHQL